MNNFLVPTTLSNVQTFIGLIDYHRNYVKGYSRMTTLFSNSPRRTTPLIGTLIVKMISIC
jgi:hypothetical protein